MQPLSGITVLDLTRFLPGAIATLSLARHGATVIKIEQPSSGDPARHIDQSGFFFEKTNAGKKSVAIDLKTAEGKEVFKLLVRSADVLVEGFRSGVMRRLGLDYDTLSLSNRRLIYLSIVGFGPQSCYANLAAHDLNYSSLTGLHSIMCPNDTDDGIPAIQISDLVGGSFHAVAKILLALLDRGKSGSGQYINISISDSLAALLTVPLTDVGTEKHPRMFDLLSGKFACYSLYPTRKGRLAVTAVELKFWRNLCRHLERADLVSEHFAPLERQKEIKKELAAIFIEQSAEEWFSQMRNFDCCVTPVRTLEQALQDGFYRNSANIGVFPSVDTMLAEEKLNAPRLGEHAWEVFESCGLTAFEIHNLIAKKAIHISSD